MGFPYRVSIKNFDTLSIINMFQYGMFRNLYGRLIRYNQDGQLMVDLPERFYWQNAFLIFEFGKKVTTVDGHVITAEDAAISLKRNIIYKRSGHGDIRNFLCPGQELKTIDDACEGIEVVGNKLILKPVKEHYGPLLLSALENADYSIIPKNSLDKALKIIDYRNTSGTYFVAKDSTIGEIKLQANPKHYLYSEKMPQEIDLVPGDVISIWNLFLEDKIDLISTGVPPVGEAAQLVMSNGNEQYNIHKSIPISVNLLLFSKEAITEFSVEQRFFVAQAYAGVVKTKLNFYEAQPTETFFRKHTNGGLSDRQEAELKSKRNLTKRPAFNRPIEILISNARFELFSKSFSEYSKEIKPIKMGAHSTDLKIHERPHAISMINDSSWLEDMGLIGYNLNFEVFKTFKLEKNKWFENYLALESKEDRNKLLQDLHYENLINAYVYPILVSPYFAVVKKPWTFNMSTLHAGTELWNIRIP